MRDKWLDFLPMKKHLPFLPDCVCRWLESLFGIEAARRIFNRADTGEAGGFFERVMEEAGVDFDFGSLLDDLPEKGSVLVVANHPFGGTDAMGLPMLCARKRDDVLVMGNSLVSHVEPFNQLVIGVNIMDPEGAARENLGAMRRCAKHLKQGGVLVVFPAGAVSRWNVEAARVKDPEWSAHVVNLALRAGATILPVRFFGQNPAWFHLLSGLHPLLRAALLPRVFIKSRGLTVRCRSRGSISLDKVDSGDAGVIALRTFVNEISDD